MTVLSPIQRSDAQHEEKHVVLCRRLRKRQRHHHEWRITCAATSRTRNMSCIAGSTAAPHAKSFPSIAQGATRSMTQGGKLTCHRRPAPCALHHSLPPDARSESDIAQCAGKEGLRQRAELALAKFWRPCLNATLPGCSSCEHNTLSQP